MGVHSTMTASSSAIGKTKLHVQRPQVTPPQVTLRQATPPQAIQATQLLHLHVLQASLVSKLSLALDVQNTSIAGMDRNKVVQLHAHLAHSSPKDFRTVTGPTKLRAMFEQLPDR